MVGVYLNLLLFTFAVLSLSAGILFCTEKNKPLYLRVFIILIAIATFLICFGYALMGFTANVEYAFIPRFVGLFGIDTFLLLELIYLLLDMKIKKIVRYIPLSFFAVYETFDLLLHGSKDSFNYMRSSLITTYEVNNYFHHIFHYSYVSSIALLLFILALRVYRRTNIRRERRFILSVIITNLLVFFAAIPDITASVIIENCPSFIYCTGFTLIFFICYFQIKRRASFIPSVENVSKEIFYTIDVPILIFDMDGTLDLCNSSAKARLHISEEEKYNLRGLFSLSDVETLHLLAKAKRGVNGVQKTLIKATGKECSLTYFVKLDYMGEPFCLIVSVVNHEETK